MDTDQPEKAAIAAGNNADLYAAMFAAHGLRFTRKAHAFVGLDPPPPYYSNLTTVSRDAVAEQMAEITMLIDVFDGRIGLKDSFCQLDLAEAGFDVLFTADWVWRDPVSGRGTDADGWCMIKSASDLALWERAWKRCGSPTPVQMFPASMLKVRGVAFWGKRGDRGFEAGCIANESRDCIGLSNVFADTLSSEIYSQAALVAGLTDPDKPLVGYESGDDLNLIHQAGFQTVGPLRIWVAKAAGS